jgi:hypothetical protein
MVRMTDLPPATQTGMAVSALAHYLQEEAVPAVTISLIRLHTEKVRRPRALWVPFELGRPLGAPRNEAFGRRSDRRRSAWLAAALRSHARHG